MALGDPYVTAEELKTSLGNMEDFDDETVVEDAVNAASRWVTTHCERDFNQADSATARTFHLTGHTTQVDDISTTSGLVVATDPSDSGTFSQSWASTEYQLEPLNGVVAGLTGWPYTRIRFVDRYVPRTCGLRPVVQITAQWGWLAVPADVKKATSIMAARLYKRRDSAEGVLSGFGDFGPVRVGTRLDPDVEMLLAPYRKNPILVA